MVLVAVVGLGLAGGIAYATIPGAGNVYTACMLKNIGTIRLIDPSLPAKSFMSHCTALETPISWNQVGQQGTPGATGATGPSDVWDVRPTSSGSLLAGVETTVVTVPLPAGSYFVSATGAVGTPGAGTAVANFSCLLEQPGGAFVGQVSGSFAENTDAAFSVQGVATLADPGTVSLECEISADGIVLGPHVDAIKVGAVH